MKVSQSQVQDLRSWLAARSLSVDGLRPELLKRASDASVLSHSNSVVDVVSAMPSNGDMASSFAKLSGGARATDTFGALDHDTNDSFGVMDADSLTEIVVTAVEEAKVAPKSYEYDEFGRVKDHANSPSTGRLSHREQTERARLAELNQKRQAEREALREKTMADRIARAAADAANPVLPIDTFGAQIAPGDLPPSLPAVMPVDRPIGTGPLYGGGNQFPRRNFGGNRSRSPRRNFGGGGRRSPPRGGGPPRWEDRDRRGGGPQSSNRRRIPFRDPKDPNTHELVVVLIDHAQRAYADSVCEVSIRAGVRTQLRFLNGRPLPEMMDQLYRDCYGFVMVLSPESVQAKLVAYKSLADAYDVNGEPTPTVDITVDAALARIFSVMRKSGIQPQAIPTRAGALIAAAAALPPAPGVRPTIFNQYAVVGAPLAPPAQAGPPGSRQSGPPGYQQSYAAGASQGRYSSSEASGASQGRYASTEVSGASQGRYSSSEASGYPGSQPPQQSYNFLAQQQRMQEMQSQQSQQSQHAQAAQLQREAHAAQQQKADALAASQQREMQREAQRQQQQQTYRAAVQAQREAALKEQREAYAAQQAFQAQYQPYVPPSPVVPAVVAVAVAPSTAAPVAQPDLRSLTSLLTLLQSNADLLAAGQTPAPVAAASTALLAQANAFYQQTQLAAKQPAAVTPIVLASPMPTHVNMHASQQMAEYTTHQQPQQQQSPAPGTSAYYAPVKPTAVPVSLQTPLQLAQFAIAQTKQFATPSPYAEQQQYGAAQNAQTAQPQITYTDAQQAYSGAQLSMYAAAQAQPPTALGQYSNASSMQQPAQQQFTAAQMAQYTAQMVQYAQQQQQSGTGQQYGQVQSSSNGQYQSSQATPTTYQSQVYAQPSRR